MKIALTAKLLQGGKLKNEEHGRSDAFSNRHANYTFDLALGRFDGLTAGKGIAAKNESETFQIMFCIVTAWAWPVGHVLLRPPASAMKASGRVARSQAAVVC